MAEATQPAMASAGLPAADLACQQRWQLPCHGARPRLTREDEMSDPLDVHRSLEHCMQAIHAAREAMAHDMHDAAMRLGAAEMMLASASYAVHKHAAARPQAQVQPDTGAEPGSEGA
jgi:hypothetical protein